jgi:hypothetical protein
MCTWEASETISQNEFVRLRADLGCYKAIDQAVSSTLNGLTSRDEIWARTADDNLYNLRDDTGERQ